MDKQVDATACCSKTAIRNNLRTRERSMSHRTHHQRDPYAHGSGPGRSGLFVGDAAIVIRCIESWIRRGHRCLGLVTADARCAEWAAWNRIPARFRNPSSRLVPADLAQLTGGATIDILWSIHNIRVLSPEILAMAQEAAINYHDALLPAYAGLHAPSWAILAREPRHGITWHRMVETLDAGNLLEQAAFPVAPDDTSWTLGLRCVEAAERTFARLLDQIESGTLTGWPQPAQGRTYCAGGRKPTPCCVVDWRRPAEEIDALVRALNFGPAENPIGLPKALTPQGVLVIRSLSLGNQHSTQPPGTIISVSEGPGETCWRIATTTRDVDVHGWTRLDGAPVAPAESEALGFHTGQVLRPAVADAKAFEVLACRLRPAEGYWRSRMRSLRPLAPPAFDSIGSEEDAMVVQRIQAGVFPAADPDALLICVLCALAHVVGEPFDAAFSEPGSSEAVPGAEVLFEMASPLRIEPEDREMRRSLAIRRTMTGYPLDLVGRSRLLRDRASELVCPVEVQSGAGCALPIQSSNRRLLIVSVRESSVDITASRRHAEVLEALAAQLRNLMETGCLTHRSETSPRNVVAAFQTRVEMQPKAIAIIESDAAHTYSALERHASTIAQALHRRDIGPGDVVAVYATGLKDLVAAVLGIARAGAAFWVLDARESDSRKAGLFREAAPSALLTDDANWFHEARVTLPHGIIPITVADGGEDLSFDRRLLVKPDSLAYLAFTSGSTGFPKAVAIEHASLAHYIHWFGHHFHLAEGDRILQVGSPAFDLSYEQIFGALTCGAALVAAPRPLGSAQELWRHIAEQGITVLDLPTALWHQLAPTLAANPELWPGSLRALCLGGEAARAGTVSILRHVATPGFRCVNTYGPTEATIVATAFEVPLDASDDPTTIVPIGRAVDGVVAEVCHDNGSLAGIGEVGELWLGGSGLGRGYHGHPGITAQAFIDTPRGRRYRTGDRVSQDHAGVLHFHGRLDRQVKISGRRIAIEEIETTLRDIPGVHEAAVIAVASEHLVAWLVLSGAKNLGDVTAEASRRFHPTLRPQRYEVVDSLPRTPTGKVDGAALARWTLTGQGSVPPGHEALEPALLRMNDCWKRSIGFFPRTPQDDFFLQGGDSLAAITLLAEIEAAFTVTLSIAELLHEPTPQGLLRRIEASTGVTAMSGLPLPPSSVIVEMRSGEGTPLVLVHCLSGHLMRLQSLSRALPEGVPCWGIQIPGLDDSAATPRTVEALAERYLEELLPRLGKQRLDVCGMSFGGLIALEMARRHAERGGHTGIVGLFDTELADHLPGWPPRIRPRRKRWDRRLRAHVRTQLEAALAVTGRTFRQLMGQDDHVRKPTEYRHFLRIARLCEAAMASYKLKPSPIPALFFAATPRPSEFYDKLQSQLESEVEVIPVPGHHLSMLEPPHVATVVRELLARRKAQ